MALEYLHRFILSCKYAIRLRLSLILVLAVKVSDFRLKTLIQVSKQRSDWVATKNWRHAVVFIIYYAVLVRVS